MTSVAEGGNAEVSLVVYFMDGIGTAKDEGKATFMLRRLAASGIVAASMRLVV